MFASLCVRCELCEIENGMGGAKGFARRHGGHGGISRIWLLLSVSFVSFVRLKTAWVVQRISHGDTEYTEVFQGFVCFSLCPL